MNFYTNCEFSADIADILREYFPNEKLQPTDVPENGRLVFLVEKHGGTECYTCFFDGHSQKESLEICSEWSDIEKKRYVKRKIKLCAYKCLKQALNKPLAWGALTGIRPTKLAYDLISCGLDVKSQFENVFLVPPEKTRLVIEILNNQKGLVEHDDKYADFYINIPFCVSRCSYCSFVSGDIYQQGRFVEPYIESLIKEMGAAFEIAGRGGYELSHLYIGGGTPTSLSAAQIERVLAAVAFKPREFTVEAGRPDTIDKDKLDVFKAFGVGRISVNPQTFCQSTLDLINRKHTISDIYDKFDLVRKYGFDINMDLIAGLPGETEENFRYSIDCAVRLAPENITVHTLALKSGSALKEKSGVADTEKEIAAMLEYAAERLCAAGYSPYYMYRQKYMVGNFENVGYSLKGKQCLYNIDMMEEVADIFACGANAISKRVIRAQNRIERAANVKDFSNYIGRTDEMIERKKRLFLD